MRLSLASTAVLALSATTALVASAPRPRSSVANAYQLRQAKSQDVVARALAKRNRAAGRQRKREDPSAVPAPVCEQVTGKNLILNEGFEQGGTYWSYGGDVENVKGTFSPVHGYSFSPSAKSSYEITSTGPGAVQLIQTVELCADRVYSFYGDVGRETSPENIGECQITISLTKDGVLGQDQIYSNVPCSDSTGPNSCPVQNRNGDGVDFLFVERVDFIPAFTGTVNLQVDALCSEEAAPFYVLDNVYLASEQDPNQQDEGTVSRRGKRNVRA